MDAVEKYPWKWTKPEEVEVDTLSECVFLDHDVKENVAILRDK